MTSSLRASYLAALLTGVSACSPSAVATEPDASLAQDAAPLDAARPAPFAGPTGGTTGCTAAPALAGVHDGTIDVRGAERTYRLVVPEGLGAGEPAPLLFALHGLGDTAANFQRALSMERVAVGAIVVYPHGEYPTLGSRGWNLEPDGDDVALFDALFAELSAGHCVDRARVFAMGFSYGAYMASALGCARGDLIRGIAPIAGGPPTTGLCQGQVSAWIAHGEADTVVNYGLFASRTRDYWRRKSGCSDTGSTDADGCTSFEGCDEGYPVVFCSHAGAHTVPSYAPAAIWAHLSALQ